MLGKIDRFLSKIEKYINWSSIKYILLSEFALMPYYFLAGMYKIAQLHRITFILSIGLSIHFLSKAIKICFDKD